MGIGNIKNAITGFVKDAGQRGAEVGKAMAKGPVLSAKLIDVNAQLASLKGWGPEVKAQRTALEGQRTQLTAAIVENDKLIPKSADILRNMK